MVDPAAAHRAVVDAFDAVAVRVEEKGAVVVVAVLRTRARGAVVIEARFRSRAPEVVDVVS